MPNDKNKIFYCVHFYHMLKVLPLIQVKHDYVTLPTISLLRIYVY
jgi:hypothetical protein